MKRNCFRWLSAYLTLVLATLGLAQETTLHFLKAGERQLAAAAAAAPIRLMEKKGNAAAFESRSASCQARATQLEDGAYTVLDLSGGGRCGEIGEPQLPCYGEFVEVPDGVAVRLVVDEVDWVELAGKYSVAPRQQPPTDKAGAPPPPFSKSQAAYQRDQFVPAEPVQLGEQVRVRRKAMVFVSYVPVAYNPALGALKAARYVRWHLEFDLQQGKAPAVPRAGGDSLGAKEHAPFFDRVLDGKPSSFSTQAVSSEALSAEDGADYLIIVHDSLYGSIQPLAQWKHTKGYKTRVVRTSEISETPTCTNITAFISNAYFTWNPAPTFVLLVGDSAYIPAWYKNNHSYYGSNVKACTDLYYSTVDGSDYFPDLLLGRLPCANAAQCDMMVSKILTVEKTPDPTQSMYRTLLTAGEYTDSGGGYEERIFIETAEAVRDFHLANGHAVPTAYCSDTATTPRHYNASQSLLHTNGALYGSAQTYVSTSAGTAAISNAINAGVWLVQHRDHGSQLGGWATPPWSPTRANLLFNGNKLPAVMSINCETAWFDGSSDSLAEAFLKNTKGGAYAVIGATRVSYSWHNDWFTHGLYECLYGNYFETLAGIASYKSGLTYGDNYVSHGSHLGQMLNFAKILMYQKEGSGTATQIEFDILTLLGDPEQSPRNAVPKTLAVIHPARVDALFPASFTVTVTSEGVPLQGALVALVMDPGEYHTATTDAAGVAPFDFEPQMPPGGTNSQMSVTVTEQNAVPYLGSITVSPRGFTVRMPGSAPEGAGTLTGQGQVFVIPKSDTELTVTLGSSDSSEVSVPASVTIPAGQTNVAFNITIVDDAELDGSQTATVSATAATYSSGTAVMTVDDNETATLCLTLPLSAAEGGECPVGQVAVSAPVGADVAVALTSSDVAELTVPPFLVIPFGQTNAAFTAVVVNDTRIDGPQRVTVTARVVNWTSGSADVSILDNEATNLVVALPAGLREGQGQLSGAGNVSISGTRTSSLFVSLASSDATELTVPSGVVIPAGQTSANFSLAVVDDLAQDGVQSLAVSASASGFTDGSAVLSVFDNDLHHFVWGQISSPKNAGTPFGVTLTAQDVNGTTISNYASTALFSGLGDHGAVVLAPTSSGAFSNGQWNANLTVNTPDTQVRLVASDGAGNSGTSGFFTVDVGPLHHFTWSPVSALQRIETPFATTVTAKDIANNTVAGFTGAVAIRALTDARQWDVLSGTTAWNYPMSTYYHDARTQSIYLNSELGGARQLSSLSLYVSTTPGQTMNAWTIRLKHTALELYGAGVWEASDWTVVVQTNLTVSATGWLTFPFETPFNYNGTNNLLVDYSFNNTFYTTEGYCWSTPVATNRSLYYRNDSYSGDPLVWSGTYPVGTLIARVPTIRLAGGLPVAVAPSNTESFASGVWSGAVTVLEPASNMFLCADDGARHVGTGGVFTVVSLGLLKVSLPASFSEGDGVLVGRGTVAVIPAPTNDLPVTLVSSDLTELVVPASVIIAEGQTNASFSVTLMDDAELDGVQAVTVAATCESYVSVPAETSVSDNEAAALSLRLPATASEGSASVSATVFASAPPTKAIAVSLASSDLTEATVPALAYLPAGQTSAVFSVTLVDDALIDGPQRVTLAATVPGWSPAAVDMTVLDNETTNLWLTLPSSLSEGHGLLVSAGSVRLSGFWPTAVTVSLACSDITELIVPGSVVIPAGQTNVAFDVTVVDDGVQDGRQQFAVTARAAGFADGNVVASVADNELHHYAWGTIPSPQIGQWPFNAELSAQDLNGATITVFQGEVALTGAGSRGPVAMTPASAILNSGVWSGSVQVNAVDSGVRLTATDAQAVMGVSNPFVVQVGPLDHFAWSAIPTPQASEQPFSVTVTAQDAANNTVTSFAGPVSLSGQLRFLDSRIMLSDSGYDYMGSGSYARGMRIRPAKDLMVTHVRHFWGASVSIWTDNGVLLVNRGFTSLNGVWSETPLVAPVMLASGTVYRVSCYSAGSYYYYRGGGMPFNFADGEIISGVTSVSGDVFPSSTSTARYLVDLRYYDVKSHSVGLSPATSGSFVDGAWKGALTVLAPASNMYVRAFDGSDHSGTSGVFTVKAFADLRLDLSESQVSGTVSSNLTYWIGVRNDGPSQATGVRVVDVLPDTAAFVSASAAQGTFTNVGRTVFWDVGAISNSGQAWAKIVAQPALGGVLTNTVTVTASSTDPSLSNNVAEALAAVTGCGVLAVTPVGDLYSRGFAGGPFSPVCQIYTLTNSGTDVLAWQAVKNADWFSLSAIAGVLPARSAVTVTAMIDDCACLLKPAQYSDSIAFSNLTTGLGSATRRGFLSVMKGGLLQTVFASDNGYAGCMFDMVPKKNLGLNAFDVNVSPAGQDVIVTVYYREDSCVGRESSSSGWHVLGSRAVTAAGLDVPTFVDLSGNGVEFMRGRTYGLYVAVDYASGVTLRYTKGASVYEDAGLTVLSNCGKGEPAFSGVTYASRIWNGALYYDTELVPDLGVSPAEGLLSEAPEGGPVTPADRVYAVSNRSTSSLTWTVGCSSNWVSVVPCGGSLLPGASQLVTVTLCAGGLAAEAYRAAVVFSNAVSGAAQSRDATLNVWGRALSVTLPYVCCEGQVLTNGGRIAISHAQASNLTVRVSCSDTNRLLVLPQALLLPGQTNVTFDIAAVANGHADGHRSVTVTAEAVGFEPGEATLTVLDDEIASNAVIMASFDLTSPPGWICTGQWQFGKPTGQGGAQFGNSDPQAGFTGTNVFGVNLRGDYTLSPGGPYCLTAGPLDASGYRNVALQFRRWLNTDLAPYVRVAVEVSTNGAVWMPVWSNGQAGLYERAWSRVVYPLPAADFAQRVFVRWSYEVGSEAYAASGWNLDDIVFSGEPVAAPMTLRGTPLAWLRLYGLTNSASEVEEALDVDHDGKSAWEEYICDTIPTNRDSVLSLLGVACGPEGVEVKWKGGRAATQYVEWKGRLHPAGEPWSAFFTNIPPTGITNAAVDAASTNSVRFYRLRAVR